MLSLIIFGIVALIVVVFLLNINIRTLSRPDKEKTPNRQPDLVSERPAPEEEREHYRESPRSPQIDDQQYRKALRQFYAAEREKDPPGSRDKLKDATYRNALRELRNKSGKE